MTDNAARGHGRFRDGHWKSADGLRLHYRDYHGDPQPTPVLCIPGLTRNARDFDPVAERLAGARRVLVAELRGRGESDYAADPATYHAGVYLRDVQALLDDLGLPRVALFGTSLGGIVAMLLGAVGDRRLAGVLLNDIGPVIEEAGLERIRGYVGAPARWESWAAAAATIAATHARAYPDYTQADWDAMARRLCRERDGAIVGDYDPAIAMLVVRPAPPPPEPWVLIEGLREMPGLLVHGALSDILGAGTAAAMVARLPDMELVTLPRIGHAAVLDEPDVVPAIDRLLARIDARAFA